MLYRWVTWNRSWKSSQLGWEKIWSGKQSMVWKVPEHAHSTCSWSSCVFSWTHVWVVFLVKGGQTSYFTRKKLRNPSHAPILEIFDIHFWIGVLRGRFMAILLGGNISMFPSFLGSICSSDTFLCKWTKNNKTSEEHPSFFYWMPDKLTF